MTSAKRQAALKARRQAAGLKLVSVWVPEERERQVRMIAKVMCENALLPLPVKDEQQPIKA